MRPEDRPVADTEGLSMALLTADEARRISSMSGGMLGSPTLASAVKKALTKVEEAAFRGEDSVTVEFL
jgi:hypothetical protein